jgi:hypothetical protein
LVTSLLGRIGLVHRGGRPEPLRLPLFESGPYKAEGWRGA